MTIDLSPVVQPLLALTMTVVTGAIPILVTALLRRLHVANSTDLAAKINTAAEAAVGEAYRVAVLHGHDLRVRAGQDSVTAIAVNYMLKHVPETLHAFGLDDPDRLNALVSARLGKLLAVDPTVSTGAPAPGLSTHPLGTSDEPVAPTDVNHVTN